MLTVDFSWYQLKISRDWVTITQNNNDKSWVGMITFCVDVLTNNAKWWICDVYQNSAIKNMINKPFRIDLDSDEEKRRIVSELIIAYIHNNNFNSKKNKFIFLHSNICESNLEIQVLKRTLHTSKANIFLKWYTKIFWITMLTVK